MAERKVVLVTGTSGYWGSRMAARLLCEAGYHVIGLDTRQPTESIQGLDFIQADIRSPLLADLLTVEEPDAVCHLAFVETTRPSEAAFDVNVLGTTKLLNACAKAGVRQVVLKSSTAVFGARPSNSAFLTEDHSLRGSRRCGQIRDLIEIETFCNGFRHRVPAMHLTILRFASIVGPTVDSPMTRFLTEPWTPSLLGFDPMMQIIHEDDVVEALVHALVNDVPGVFNVAAEGVIPLNKIRGLVGKPLFSVFHPLAYWGVSLLSRSRVRLNRYVPIELDYIRYPWVADLRRMREELNFQPRYTAEEALRQFAERRHLGHLSESAVLACSEERLRNMIELRRRAKQQ